MQGWGQELGTRICVYNVTISQATEDMIYWYIAQLNKAT